MRLHTGAAEPKGNATMATTLPEHEAPGPQVAQEHTPTPDPAAVEAFAMRVAQDRANAYNAVLVYLGDRLGIWRELAVGTPFTVAQVVARCGIAERYAREWLAAQAAAGYLTYDATTETFTLPVEHALVLADEDSPASGIAGYEVIAAVWAAADRLANAYVSGEGVGWHEHDPRLYSGVDRFYGSIYRSTLVQQWVPAVDGLAERLEAGARVLDVGCGLGTATILLAEAFPRSTFVGVDYHEESIRRANIAAAEAGVAERVSFVTGDATSYGPGVDVVCFFDSLHDLGDPVGALTHARSALAPGGRVFAVEPFAEDGLAANLENPVALTFYVGSSCLCVPNSVDQGGAALGAQAGAARLLEAFREAGFDRAEVAARTPFNLLLDARV
jgi:SAM-dependent methyltransferase